MSASINRSSILVRKQDAAHNFAVMGGRDLAYIRVARSEDVAFFCPEAQLLAPGQNVFVLCAADGTPILVTDTHESAVAGAEQERLKALRLH